MATRIGGIRFWTLALAIAVAPVAFSGCQTGKIKMPNLAFWKKDAPQLSARHENYVEPPASQLSPSGASLASNNDSVDAPPTRPPYQVDESNSGSDTRVASNSGSGLKPYSATVEENRSTLDSYGSGSRSETQNLDSPPVEIQTPNRQINELANNSANNSSADGSSMRGGSFGGGSFGGGSTSTSSTPSNNTARASQPANGGGTFGSTQPTRTTNPYATANNALNEAATTLGSAAENSLDNLSQAANQLASNTGDYPSTSYKSFVPQTPSVDAPTHQIDVPASNRLHPIGANTNLTTQQPTTTVNEPKVLNPYVNQPQQNSPLAQVSLNSNDSPRASAIQTQSEPLLPMALTQSQGSYAPGSVSGPMQPRLPSANQPTQRQPIPQQLIPRQPVPQQLVPQQPVQQQLLNQGPLDQQIPSGGSFPGN